MTVAEDHIRRVVDAIRRDLVVTLGWHESEATVFIERDGCVEDCANHADEALTLAEHVIGNVQEAIQRELIDTTWPACPMHQTHPLTIDGDLVWRCPAENKDDPGGFMRRVPLGWLDTIWPPRSP